MEAPAAAPPRPEPVTVRRVDEGVSDGDLLQRIADGDPRAFETLYRRFARPVLGLALRLLRDRGRAEDAVQETFAAIWRSAGRASSGASTRCSIATRIARCSCW